MARRVRCPCYAIHTSTVVTEACYWSAWHTDIQNYYLQKNCNKLHSTTKSNSNQYVILYFILNCRLIDSSLTDFFYNLTNATWSKVYSFRFVENSRKNFLPRLNSFPLHESQFTTIRFTGEFNNHENVVKVYSSWCLFTCALRKLIFTNASQS